MFTRLRGGHVLTDGTIRPVASIVVPAYKSANTIIQCIESLVLQETEVPFEVIVVESSSDGAADLIRKNFPQVRVVQSPSRLLSGAARNLGASCSSGSLLLFIDSDCVADPTWVEQMWQTHRDFDGAGVCGAVLNGNAEHLVSVASYITEFNVFFPHGSSRLMDYLVSCN
ncbi:MAG: glycosyltransferase family 2 protein, partial [Armatimonadota bacterium]